MSIIDYLCKWKVIPTTAANARDGRVCLRLDDMDYSGKCQNANAHV